MKSISIFLRAVAVLSLAPLDGANACTVRVDARPLWTDTGINLNGEDLVSITASGSWRWARNRWVGPEGVCDGTTDTFLDNGTHGMLIAFVGPDPFEGQQDAGDFFPQTTGYWGIGRSGQFASPCAGRLWLGFNDDAVTGATSDNAGFVVADISIESVPEPGAFSLVFGSGVLGCAGLIRRKPGA